MVIEANLAGIAFDCRIVAKLQHVLIEQGLGVLEGLFNDFNSIRTLTHIVLNSAQFESHSRGYIVNYLLSL